MSVHPIAYRVIASRLVDAYRGSLLGINARTRALQVFSKGVAERLPVSAVQDQRNSWKKDYSRPVEPRPEDGGRRVCNDVGKNYIATKPSKPENINPLVRVKTRVIV